MGTFEDRLKQYDRPAKWNGESTEKNIDKWSERASANSKIAPRAKDGEIDLPSTKVRTRDTAQKPFVKRSAEAMIKAAREDTNNVDSGNYCRGIRREA
jgi:hypothetical protein